jgi:hypothetical protein
VITDNQNESGGEGPVPEGDPGAEGPSRVEQAKAEALDSPIVFHPVLWAVLPAVSLFANNIGRASGESLFRSVSLLLALGVGLYLICWAIFRDRYRGGILASLILFTSLTGWGILENVLAWATRSVTGVPTSYMLGGFVAAAAVGAVALMLWLRPGRAAVIRGIFIAIVVTSVTATMAYYWLAPAMGKGPGWGIVAYLTGMIVFGVLLMRKSQDFHALTRTFNTFVVVLIVLYVAYGLLNRPPAMDDAVRADSGEPLFAVTEPAPDSPDYPDIYFIVLDGYGRGDALLDTFGYNNYQFLEAMGQLGFYVVPESHANYVHTPQSLASCLNMRYLQDVLVELPDDPRGLGPAPSLLQSNRVYDVLRERGYDLALFSPGIDSLEPRDNVARVLRPPWALSEFEMILLNRAVVGRALQVAAEVRNEPPWGSPEALRVARVDYTFTQLTLLAQGGESRQPRFVFAYLPLPDPPFHFLRDGSRNRSYGGYFHLAGGMYPETARDFVRGYCEQLFYANMQVVETVTHILQQSARPPVILIASSRGPSLDLAAAEDPVQARVDRLKNLIMVRLPPNAKPYPRMSMVNLFRVTLNAVLDEDVALARDDAYVSGDSQPYAFTHIPESELYP